MSDTDEEYPKNNSKKKQSPSPTKPCTIEDVDGEYKCNQCGSIFPSKNVAYKHMRKCSKRKAERMKRTPMLNKCMWCGLEFKNRGNLVSHALHMHGDSSYKSITDVNRKVFICGVCDKSYKNSNLLRHHIRSLHFNLKAKVPYAEHKKVNQIWFEKEQTTNKILEIRKTGENKLIMRSLSENTTIKVNDVNTEVIDLSHIYPTKDTKRADCKVCGISFLKKDLKKHLDERHMNRMKHVCNNCNRTFKRSYLYLKHNCSTTKRLKGVTHCKFNTEFRISSVESLHMPLG